MVVRDDRHETLRQPLGARRAQRDPGCGDRSFRASPGVGGEALDVVHGAQIEQDRCPIVGRAVEAGDEPVDDVRSESLGSRRARIDHPAAADHQPSPGVPQDEPVAGTDRHSTGNVDDREGVRHHPNTDRPGSAPDMQVIGTPIGQLVHIPSGIDRCCEPFGQRPATRGREHLAPRDLSPVDPREIRRDPEPGADRLDIAFVRLQPTDPDLAPGWIQRQLVADGQTSRDQRPGDDRPCSWHREGSIDPQSCVPIRRIRDSWRAQTGVTR